ncbi:hypothetical protein FE257_012284 [Aspergillus nanangensis]|uniref:Uncharacterized protein n=1 Tax=Aspergillus nanangensis TaxID=2582783 RepID=A0AAD4CHB8_ASPNN|nr:hypothetical protein FE257_012284 [Aspergillus nanangensis]
MTTPQLEQPPPSPETDSECEIAYAQLRTRYKAHHDQKPILIFICPKGLRFWARFRSVLLKIQRDARIMYAINLAALDALLATHGTNIAGFIITDTKIMEPEIATTIGGGRVRGSDTEREEFEGRYRRHHRHRHRHQRATTSADELDDNEDEWADDEFDVDDEDDDELPQPPLLPGQEQEQNQGGDSDGTGTGDRAEDGSSVESVNSDWVPSDDEGTVADMQVADSPVAIHEVKSWVDNGNDEAILIKGYVGFVGHVEDNRSMSSLILGMCAVGEFVPPS